MSPRGFASLPKDRLRQIASAAGRRAHDLGRAHEWTREEASVAGKKGIAAKRRKREARTP